MYSFSGSIYMMKKVKSFYFLFYRFMIFEQTSLQDQNKEYTNVYIYGIYTGMYICLQNLPRLYFKRYESALNPSKIALLAHSHTHTPSFFLKLILQMDFILNFSIQMLFDVKCCYSQVILFCF